MIEKCKQCNKNLHPKTKKCRSCISKKAARKKTFNEVANDKNRYGSLFLTGKAEYRSYTKTRPDSQICFVECVCDCGSKKFYGYHNLKKGTIKSCGCKTKQLMSKAKTGLRKHEGYTLFAPYFMRQLKRHCKRGNDRQLDFTLTIEDLDNIYYEQNGKCYFSGENLVLPDFSLGHKYTKSKYNVSVDRLDSNLGYHKSNCVLCLSICNQMKMDMTENDFIKMCNKISEHKRS
jgi:hypothetical protein